MAADHGLTLRILIVFLAIVTVLLLIRHYQKSKNVVDTFAQNSGNPFVPRYSTDIYVSPTTQQQPSLPSEVTRPFDQGVAFYGETQPMEIPDATQVRQATTARAVLAPGMSASEPVSNEVFRVVDYKVNPPPKNNTGCFPKDKLTASDLLPKDAANSTWSKVMPAGQGDVQNQNFLTAGYQVGLSSSVIRNPNYGLRSEPPNPQVTVSPWMNTTIDPDLMRRPLELASSPVC